MDTALGLLTPAVTRFGFQLSTAKQDLTHIPDEEPDFPISLGKVTKGFTLVVQIAVNKAGSGVGRDLADAMTSLSKEEEEAATEYGDATAAEKEEEEEGVRKAAAAAATVEDDDCEEGSKTSTTSGNCVIAHEEPSSFQGVWENALAEAHDQGLILLVNFDSKLGEVCVATQLRLPSAGLRLATGVYFTYLQLQGCVNLKVPGVRLAVEASMEFDVEDGAGGGPGGKLQVGWCRWTPCC